MAVMSLQPATGIFAIFSGITVEQLRDSMPISLQHVGAAGNGVS
jgi:hypothetical protein